MIVPLLIGVAYLTLLERKVMASMQRRKGPNVVGLYGLLQPLADGLKLFLKESIIPSGAHKGIFILSPILTFFLAVMGWAAVPFGEGMVYADINIGILYIFAVSSLGVYGVICSGWSSNTKYSFLGALRSSAQMISYEIGMGFILLLVFLLVGSLNLTDIVLAQQSGWFCFPLIPSSHDLTCVYSCRNKPSPIWFTWSGSRISCGLFHRIFCHGIRSFLLRRVFEHDSYVFVNCGLLLRWMIRSLNSSWIHLIRIQSRVRSVWIHLSSICLPTVPFRPAHVSWLEKFSYLSC